MPREIAYVAMNGNTPTSAATTLDAAQNTALSAEKQYDNGWDFRWEEAYGDSWRLMYRSTRTGRWSWTQRAVYVVPWLADEAS